MSDPISRIETARRYGYGLVVHSEYEADQLRNAVSEAKKPVPRIVMRPPPVRHKG